MIKIEHIEIWGFAHAIRGMRNPMNSWDKSDTIYGEYHGKDENGNDIIVKYDAPQIGTNDSDLMRRLFMGGTEHRKFMRQIFVSMDITAPLYWWKEFDTYKVGTTANSCSTMHKLMAKPFDIFDFSVDQMNNDAKAMMLKVIGFLNVQREMYLKSKDNHLQGSKEFWWNIIQMLPSSYNQKRTVTMNYENAASMISQRTGHKLEEWRVFVEHLQELPHMDTIVLGNWEKEGEEV